MLGLHGSMLDPNRVIAKVVKSCTYCCYVRCAILIVWVGGSGSTTATPHKTYHNIYYSFYSIFHSNTLGIWREKWLFCHYPIKDLNNSSCHAKYENKGHWKMPFLKSTLISLELAFIYLSAKDAFSFVSNISLHFLLEIEYLKSGIAIRYSSSDSLYSLREWKWNPRSAIFIV